MTAQLLRKKFTIEEFQQMAEVGIINDDDRLELIEGEIIDMGKIGSKHAAYVARFNDLLRDKLVDTPTAEARGILGSSSQLV